MILKQLLGITLLGSLIFTGCTSVPTSRIEGPAFGEKVSQDDIRYSGFRLNTVAIIDRSLQRHYIERNFLGDTTRTTIGKLAVEAMGSKYNETGTMKAWTTIRNRTNHNLQIECRVSFYDEDKMHVEGPSAWQRIMLNPNSIESCIENSLSFRGIKYYYIEVREGR